MSTLADQRHVQVLVAERVETQHALAQRQVAVQRRQAPVHVGEQLLVDGDRDVVLEQRRRQRRCRSGAPASEQVGLHRRGQRRAHRALVRLERAEERREHLVAVGADAPGRCSVNAAGSRRTDSPVDSLMVGYGRSAFDEDAVHLAARACHLARLGDDLLLGARSACAACAAASPRGTRGRARACFSCGDELPHLGAGSIVRISGRTHERAAVNAVASSSAACFISRGRASRTSSSDRLLAYTDEPRQLAVDVEHRLSAPAQQILRPTCRGARGAWPARAAASAIASLACGPRRLRGIEVRQVPLVLVRDVRAFRRRYRCCRHADDSQAQQYHPSLHHESDGN